MKDKKDRRRAEIHVLKPSGSNGASQTWAFPVVAGNNNQRPHDAEAIAEWYKHAHTRTEASYMLS
jgi:hypothetical protein